MVGPLLVDRQTHAFNVQFDSPSQPVTYLVLLAMVPQQKVTRVCGTTKLHFACMGLFICFYDEIIKEILYQETLFIHKQRHAS